MSSSATRRRPAGALRWAVRALAVIAVLSFLLRTFFFGLYLVDSHSMEPALHGGPPSERVLVRYASGWEPRRFDPVVLLRAGQAEAEVKRVVGLPGESVQVREGDLWINGAVVAWDEPRPELVCVFEARRHAFEDSFSGVEGELALDGNLWSLAPHPNMPREPFGFEYRLRFNDDYEEADGEIVRGVEAVNDGALEVDLRVLDGQGWFVVELTEKGDRFEFELETLSENDAALRIWRAPGLSADAGDRKLLAARPIPFGRGAWRRVRVANVDNSLSWSVDGALVLQQCYERNEPAVGPDPDLRHVAPRLRIEAKSLRLELRDLRVLRDVYYTQLGRYGVAAPVELGPTEIFVLGDNSAVSRDSREWGPVSLESVVGKPQWVVWPWRQRRRLGLPTLPGDG